MKPGAARRARPSSGRVRLEEVAAAAGVSPATVSRTLRQPELVAEATREAVQGAVARLGYIPDLVAGSLASVRTGQVAIVVPSLATPAFMGTVRGISDTLLPMGLQCVLGDRNLSGDNETMLLTSLLGRRADAVILADVVESPASRALLERCGVPVVESWTLTRDPVDMNVGFDNRAAARAATGHLVAIGRRRIGMICGPLQGNARGRLRRRGFLDALRRAGMAADLFIELPFPPSLGDVDAALHALMQRAPEMDAVFCSGDTFAVGALFAAQRHGWAVPGRLAIAGLGDLDLADQVVPAISGARIPGYRMGQIAAQMVLRRLAGLEVAPRIVDVGFTLAARGSSVA